MGAGMSAYLQFRALAREKATPLQRQSQWEAAHWMKALFWL
jgi:hypothetical protein